MMREDVIDRNRHSDLLSRLNMVRELSIERRVPAYVLGHQFISHPDLSFMCGSFYSDKDPFTCPTSWDPNKALVVDFADMVSQRWMEEYIIIRSRDRALHITRKGIEPWCFEFVRVGYETPKTI
jgi:hypothetical protein